MSYRNHNGGTGVDGGGFDLDGGTTNSTITMSFSFFNDGPGFLVCQFEGANRETRNNTIRDSVSLDDVQGGVTVYGDTWVCFMSIFTSLLLLID